MKWKEATQAVDTQSRPSFSAKSANCQFWLGPACSLPKMTSQKRQANNSFPQCSGNRYFYFLENSPASVSPSLPQLRAATSLRKINSCSLNSFKMLLLRSKPTFNADTHTACKILILFFFKCALDTWSYLENDLLAWVQ